jgi:dimethylhistidine N-methyltransferase
MDTRTVSGFRLIDRVAQRPQPDLAAEIAASLFAPAASLSPKFFYDAAGCELFVAITALPEYYPTRTEAAIFAHQRGTIAAACGSGRQFVDLGAGDCQKAACWFPFLSPSHYVAIDVARGPVERALARFAVEAPEIAFTGLIDDFSQRLDLEGVLGDGPATFFYPGSSIGNFTPDAALRLLAQIRAQCDASGSGLLIGADLVKDEATLVAAYDDAAGVTAAFNRNALHHVNRLTGAGIDVAAFRHVALFNRAESRIEMHLEATRATRIAFSGRERTLQSGEGIHTENSYKYQPEDFIAMLNRAGFNRVEWWTDDARRFGVFHAAP